MASSGNKVSLKLLIDKRRERVLFGEAGKDFVDFLFQIFTLHLGSVVSLLSPQKMVGCLGKLYQSIENLSNTYMQPSANKHTALNPKTVANATDAPLLLTTSSNEKSAMKGLYRCPNSSFTECDNYVSDDTQALCPRCKIKLTKQLKYVEVVTGNESAAKTEEERGGGYVKGVVTYMIMDDLEIKPMSAVSSISLLSKFKVKDLGALEEKVVFLGMDEGLKLLKASLQSKSVLTDVFFVKELSIQ